jgi:drug/metabolite transporter superfamily protein YnfA
MMENGSESSEKIWKKFLRIHLKMLVVFVVVAILAVTGAILVFLWFVGDAQATSLIPGSLNLWNMGYLVTFLLHMIFWEIVFIGIPLIITALAIFFLWWKKLPTQERHEYRHGHLFGKQSRSRDGGGAITFLINIGFIIKVYLDGNWNVPFASWTFDYLVYSYLWVIIWMVIIFGIPLVIGTVLWLHREMKKTT